MQTLLYVHAVQVINIINLSNLTILKIFSSHHRDTAQKLIIPSNLYPNTYIHNFPATNKKAKGQGIPVIYSPVVRARGKRGKREEEESKGASRAGRAINHSAKLSLSPTSDVSICVRYIAPGRIIRTSVVYRESNSVSCAVTNELLMLVCAVTHCST